MTIVERLQGINIYLVGMMGAGKSSTGSALAELLGYQFFDTDTVLEAATGQTIPAIFEHQGEAAFRELETQVLAELSAYKQLVIATGGGIVTQQINWSYLHHGIVVWLDVPFEVLEQRLAGDMGRPLLQNHDWQATLKQLMEQRHQLYAQADVRITIGPEEAVEAIAARAVAKIEERIRPETDSPVTN